MKYVRSFFPHSDIQNIRLYYILTFLSELYFIIGNWVFFWIKYMTYGQLGLLDMFAFSFGFIMEVPTGAIADRIGRKKTIMSAFFLAALGFLIIATANGQIQLIVGFLIAQIGWAFYSGSGEALAYDTLKENKKEEDFEKVVATTNMLTLNSYLIGAVLGGILFSIHFRLPHLLTGGSFIVGFIVSLFLHEPHFVSEHFSIKKYFGTIKTGFQQLLLPKIKPFLPLIFVTAGIGFMYSTGIIQPALAQRFGYDGTTFSYLSALAIIISTCAVRSIPWFRTHVSDMLGLRLLGIIFIIGFVLVAFPLGYAGGIVMVILSINKALTAPWVSVVVNRELPSEYRATALSAIEMIKKIPYILVAGIAGAMIDKQMLFQLCLGIAIVVLTIMVVHRIVVKKKL
jgi:MFS family permease